MCLNIKITVYDICWCKFYVDGDDKGRDAVCFVSCAVRYCTSTVRIRLPVFGVAGGVEVERVTRYIMILCGFFGKKNGEWSDC